MTFKDLKDFLTTPSLSFEPLTEADNPDERPDEKWFSHWDNQNRRAILAPASVMEEAKLNPNAHFILTSPKEKISKEKNEPYQQYLVLPPKEGGFAF